MLATSDIRLRGWMRTALLALTLVGTLTQARGSHKHSSRCKNIPDNLIGLQLYTVRDRMDADAPGTLAAAADAGYRNVEPFSFHGYTASEFADLLDTANLLAPSLHIDIDTLAGNITQLIADAKKIGAHYIIMAWTPPKWRTEEGIAKLANILNDAGRAMQGQGLQLGYHNHDFEFGTTYSDGRTMFDALASAANPQLVKFEIDLYWVVAGGADPVDVIEQYGDRIAMLHVKDRAKNGSFADVGEGTIDFADIFATRPFEYYMVENDQPDDSIDSINDSFRGLRDICY
jgi:sugar phosphate isomerase/epimerase